jgi:hypothetical protein
MDPRWLAALIKTQIRIEVKSWIRIPIETNADPWLYFCLVRKNHVELLGSGGGDSTNEHSRQLPLSWSRKGEKDQVLLLLYTDSVPFSYQGLLCSYVVNIPTASLDRKLFAGGVYKLRVE